MLLRTAFSIVFFLTSAFCAAQDTLDLGALDSVGVPAAAPAESVTVNDPAVTAAPIPAENAADPTPPKKRKGFFDIVMAGGVIGYIIILLSLVSVALMIEHGLTIRQKVLMPTGFADEILNLLSQGKLKAAIQRCDEDPSVLAKILHGGMAEYELGWEAVEKGAEEATAEQAARLYRKIEYLNVIGNIAPMLGLLGTVVGMVFAFQQLAESEGYARAADLAEGIYLALVTTVQGLIVAIPSLAAFSIFSNRVAFLIAETTFVAEQVLHPIKINLARKPR